MEELINKTSSLLVADLDDLVVDETSVLKEYELTLLAKIISSKQPNPKVVQAILQKAWNPLKGMKLQSLQNNIFSITFTHEWDRNRILASRSWSVLNAHVVVRDWPPHLNLEEIDFSKSSFWIRVTGLPPNLMSRQNAERIGAKIGRVMEVDFIADGNVAWLRFLRIQVQIDINNPLHTGFYRIKEPNNEVWTRVQYERLPDFCFSCGRLGHTNRGCPHPPTEPPDNLSSPYGPWLRAESPDPCPRSAFWNPIVVKNRANLPDPTSGTFNLPEKSSSDLPDPTLSDNSSLDQPDPSLPDFLGANLGILPPPKALTLAHSDQSFDKTRHQSSEKRDKASNQSPPFFPQFKALNNTETIPKAGTIPHQPGSPPPTKSAPNPHQLILSPNTQQKRKCKFTLELQTKKPNGGAQLREEAHSLSLDSWKKIDAANVSCILPGTPVCLNGIIHWLAQDSHEDGEGRVVLFNIGKELFGEMSRPPFNPYLRVFPLFTSCSNSLAKGSRYRPSLISLKVSPFAFEVVANFSTLGSVIPHGATFCGLAPRSSSPSRSTFLLGGCRFSDSRGRRLSFALRTSFTPFDGSDRGMFSFPLRTSLASLAAPILALWAFLASLDGCPRGIASFFALKLPTISFGC
ncbi:hypothetical protein RJ640_000655 [Escallonia rubra]|uniref:CCHC-type domain-containing protein n=1 Tax=Escallonia rubra TaxID=112253 RepID=A0AA88U2Q5_9ASTE|nr:hypothetical protein RJ640_000655 [Escallonia rubra]